MSPMPCPQCPHFVAVHSYCHSNNLRRIPAYQTRISIAFSELFSSKQPTAILHPAQPTSASLKRPRGQAPDSRSKKLPEPKHTGQPILKISIQYLRPGLHRTTIDSPFLWPNHQPTTHHLPGRPRPRTVLTDTTNNMDVVAKHGQRPDSKRSSLRQQS
jgi:hypothetical protein